MTVSDSKDLIINSDRAGGHHALTKNAGDSSNLIKLKENQNTKLKKSATIDIERNQKNSEIKEESNSIGKK
jgi:hypothetical protein